MEFLLGFFGFCAGFIDSIAGGGGLITLPVLSFYLEPGATAIGTNKIVGMVGAGIAFLVYLKKNKLKLKNTFVFGSAIGIGSLMGSRVAPLLSKDFFQLFMIFALPVLFFIISKKNLWVNITVIENENIKSKKLSFLKKQLPFITGIAAGFYDGFFGPGGGTFMFLGLLLVVQMPLFEALVSAKFVNLISASFSLVSYQSQGFVHWKEGVYMALGMGLGAFLGARFTSKNAERIVRPALMGVISLLMMKLIFDLR